MICFMKTVWTVYLGRSRGQSRGAAVFVSFLDRCKEGVWVLASGPRSVMSLQVSLSWSHLSVIYGPRELDSVGQLQT